jgi:hypothetical protein
VPLHFVVAPHAVNYPFDYGSEAEINLYPFQLPIYIDDIPAVHQWIQRQGPVFGQESEQTYVILDKFNRAIARGFTYVRREEPGVQSPGTTIKFVSGYMHVPALESGSATTHAWAEVYLPGADWKGFDTTADEVTGSYHSPGAVTRHPLRRWPEVSSARPANGRRLRFMSKQEIPRRHSRIAMAAGAAREVGPASAETE